MLCTIDEGSMSLGIDFEPLEPQLNCQLPHWLVCVVEDVISQFSAPATAAMLPRRPLGLQAIQKLFYKLLFVMVFITA